MNTRLCEPPTEPSLADERKAIHAQWLDACEEEHRIADAFEAAAGTDWKAITLAEWCAELWLQLTPAQRMHLMYDKTPVSAGRAMRKALEARFEDYNEENGP